MDFVGQGSNEFGPRVPSSVRNGGISLMRGGIERRDQIKLGKTNPSI
jgi:hypothetical protein